MPDNNQPLDQATARALVAQITAGLDKLRDAVIQLWEGRGWIALGYSDWDDLCAAEFQMRLQLPRTVRLRVVSQLTERGMSSRAIGYALRVDQKTVVNDRRSGEEISSPQTTIGLDGKRHRATPTEAVPLRRNQPEPQPWVPIMVSLNAAGRALAPVERTLDALPAQIAARDADLITERIQQISSVLDRLTEHIETGGPASDHQAVTEAHKRREMCVDKVSSDLTECQDFV